MTPSSLSVNDPASFAYGGPFSMDHHMRAMRGGVSRAFPGGPVTEVIFSGISIVLPLVRQPLLDTCISVSVRAWLGCGERNCLPARGHAGHQWRQFRGFP